MTKNLAVLRIPTRTPARGFLLPLVLIAASLPIDAQSQVDPALRAAIADPLSTFPRDRLTSPVNESAWTTLPGSVHSQARAEFDAGPAPGDTVMLRMTLALQRTPEQQAALDALSEALQNPGSPLFHKWLTPQEFGQHFGLTQNDLDRVSAWL